MSAPDKDRVNRLVLELLAENPDDAAVALFTRLCRQSPKLRAWLWDEFARSPKTRAEFARVLAQTGKADNLTLAHAAGEDRARDLENARLRDQWAESTLRPYGGLSRPEVEGWIRRYQSGSLHPATFQLVLAWRRTTGMQPASPALIRASAAFLAEALGRDNRGLLRQLVRIERFFRDRQKLGRAAYGHLHRWKVHVLLYVLNHPKRSYRTGELTAHLATKKIRVSGKLIRRFCARHGIARDTRPGRPVGMDGEATAALEVPEFVTAITLAELFGNGRSEGVRWDGETVMLAGIFRSRQRIPSTRTKPSFWNRRSSWRI